MSVICTTNQFTTTGGILGLSRNAQSRVVARSRAESIGDGPHKAHAPADVVPPEDAGKVNKRLKTMIDQRVHWKNDYGVPVMCQVQIQRGRRTMWLSAPNFAFIRERWTHRVGLDSGTNVLAPDPDPTTIWETEWGGGIDLGVGDDGKARYGEYRNSAPASTLMLEPVRVGVGESLDVRFRASLITPWVWWQPNRVHRYHGEMYAFYNDLLIWAFPEPAD